MSQISCFVEAVAGCIRISDASHVKHVEVWGYFAPEKHPKRTFTQPDRAKKTTMCELMKAKKPAGDGMERDEFEHASSVVGFSGARFRTLKSQYFARETD